jgi:SNF2 family DNA or RNA helicase
VSIAEQLYRKGDAEIFRRCKEAFGRQRNAQLEDGPSSFQDSLLKSEYPYGGKLRDYQAEGVSWLISNYINKRSSILADEMGKFGDFLIP